MRGDHRAQMGEIGACFGHGLADLRADFDLALEELGADLPSSSAVHCCIRDSGAATSSRLSQSTRRYSSSTPRVKLGFMVSSWSDLNPKIQARARGQRLLEQVLRRFAAEKGVEIVERAKPMASRVRVVALPIWGSMKMF
jgi:hypothetical protein